MLSRPGELVALGLEDIPDALVGRAQRADLAALPDVLPAACTLGGFECRLDDDPQVDFGLCLERDRSFSGLGQPWDCAETLPGEILRFIDAWVDHDSGLREKVELIWLGFDRNGTAAANTPFIYFAPSFAAQAFAKRDDDSIERVSRRGLELLAPDAHDKALDLMRACFDSLPESAEVLMLASLQPRGVDALRLELRMPTLELPDYLVRIGWPGDAAWLSATIDALDCRHWHMPLQIELSDRVLPTLSLEFPVTPGAVTRFDWERVLEQFERLGYCQTHKRIAVSDWLHRRSADNDRQLDLKIRNDGRGGTVAKAYLVVEDTLSLF